MIFKSSYKKYLPLAIIAILFLAIYLVGTNVPEATIREIIKSAGPFGVIVFILLVWLTNVIAPLSATPFLFVGFYLYGSNVVIYSFFAAFIASISNFWIARIWGEKVVLKLAGADSIKRIDSLTKDFGFQTLFIIRVILNPFHDLISYVFGLTPMHFVPYLIISTLGAIPGTIIWYLLSSKIQNPTVFTGITLAMGYLFLSGYVLWLKITKKEKFYSKPNK